MADIELVIKMPEEIYKYIMKQQFYIPHLSGKTLVEELIIPIANGTPLPKGHGGLIDVDYLREDFRASKKISFADRMDISCIVDHAPIVIEADKTESGDIINLCNQCSNKRCTFQSGIVRSHCDFYKAESEE